MLGISTLACHRALRCAAGLALVLTLTSPVRAADASAWDVQPHAAVRLIAGTASAKADDTLRAGIEMTLDRGWKTYWRYPGDAGVPPRFGFGRSDNVEAVAISWPAPHGFSDDGSGVSIGYSGRVIFPLRVTPKDRAKPVVLRLDVEFAICEKLCVPAEGAAEIALDGAASSHEAALTASEARVPRRRSIGDTAPLAVRAVMRQAGSGPPRVLVDVAVPAGVPVELFAEGPTADWALPVPAPVAGGPAGSRRFSLDLDGLPPGATAEGATVTLTVVSPDDAIEVTTRLD
ncbi:MAG: protein-disulfide reductase DsbD domain-containing protein [Xanthobacteraceae bacterium]|jgi:DsbC/DsbD-like thiol-disulfide interchange protein